MLGPVLVGLLALCVFAVAPARDADAATVTVGKSRDGFDEVVYYVAGPGEVNDVVVVAVGDARVRITDAGAIIAASGRCKSVDAHIAVCHAFDQIAHIAAGDRDDRVRTPPRPRYGEPELILNGGSGNDELVAQGEFDRLNGGDGNDQLYGGGGGDELDGGGGADRLYGGGNTDDLDGGGGLDELFGGPESDVLTDGDRDGAPGDAGPGPDTLVGDGPGHAFWENGDTLSYEQRSQPVSVHAGVDHHAGEAGERDNISGIENIAGGAGDDRVVGDEQVNYLDGRGQCRHRDRRWRQGLLDGGARRGRDRLFGGRDPDKLTGGRGRDALLCGTPRRDPQRGRTPYSTLEPPRGDDVLLVSKRSRLREIVPNSCEQLIFSWGRFDRSVGVRPHPTRTRPWWLSVRTACPNVYDDAWVGCRGTISVRESRRRHRLLAIGRFSHGDDGARFAVPLALTSLGYRWRAGRLGRSPAIVALRMSAETTPTRPFKWTIRAPRRA